MPEQENNQEHMNSDVNSINSLPKNDHERIRRTKIMNSLDNLDYLMLIAAQQKKSIAQVTYELKLQLINGD
ncbi:hypothetical protein CORT_0A04880 [Candida orthopsilosis Co 90-125]|uniref:Uncharacterized protein n=1 Tax=Candida orthopsilosis (strain 90-125) TaxID=1136231 RepID=H8WXS9_CANO9|nr:hypothetical protein CORT_0A04880 [Candida orthopsilosis Co 90-125]CCG20876.1 hypothetical protein CORT_0A04880 [Candida orthopsilosis Co 90-125]